MRPFRFLLLLPVLGLLAIATVPSRAAERTKPHLEVQPLLERGRVKLDTDRQFDEAERLLNDALREARTRKDAKGESEALRWLGNVSDRRNSPQKAVEYYEQSLALC